MSQVKHVETASIGTIRDGNSPVQGDGSNSINALLEAKALLEKLKETEEELKVTEKKAKSTIQGIQENIDESAKQMATRNANHHKRKQELEEKCQKKIAKLESKHMQENASFAKEMTSFKEHLKEKINWNKFIWSWLGKKLVIPIANSKGNFWKTQNSISISADGLKATNNGILWQTVYAEKGFHISVDFPGPLLFYFEVTYVSYGNDFVGLSNRNIPDGSVVGELPNSYAIHGGSDRCWLSGVLYDFEWSNGAIKPEWKAKGDVYGCGLLLNNEQEELAIFFTQNGILMRKTIQIISTENTLYPTVSMYENGSIEANFGDDSAKPFKYDIKKCPGMIFE